MAYADHPRQEILLPVKRSFIALTLIVALVLNLIPLQNVALAAWPDFIALALLYWCISQPQLVGISIAFGMGLLMDIGDASTFGQHALAYSIMAFVALVLHRRLSNFGPMKQAPQIGLILIAGQFIILLTGLLDGSHFPGWDFFLASVSGTLLWPFLSSMLRIPQKPRSDTDAR
ncbi:rod shape-determining protein MreD [Nitrosovibrio sp. Nv6]|uniref:rod shape-determining protein MreD n=1 Tax=Nitrosovibrio sp. Nv6 TaxID=1855340 RepID=UPI0008D0D1A7|nr:rod shape-determining protein MreD [Nitrosovibrio sp. Nv6]SEP08885.1 rod shape-determining protein MreD [Nitrosovibrio sp. Nv6]